MPLIPLDHIKTWYLPTSLVYRSYAYMYSNKLWTRNVPKGAAVCPLFWLALFSMLVFQPIIEPLVRALVWATKLLRLSRALGLLDRVLSHVSLFKVSMSCPGLNSILFVLSTILIGAAGMIVWTFGYTLHQGAATAGVTDLFWIGISFLASLVGIKVIELKTSLSGDRAVTIFLMIALCAVLLAAALHPALFAAPFIKVASWVWSLGVYLIAGMIGGVIATWDVMLVGTALLAVAAYVGYKLDYIPDYQTYMVDWKLRATRLMIKNWIVQRVYYSVYELDSRERPYDNLDSMEWRGRVKDSPYLESVVIDIVDSLAWLKVREEDLGISISAERLASIVEGLYVEHTDEMAKQEREVQDMIKVRERRKARAERFKNSVVARALSRLGGAIRRGAGHVVTFACVVWELIKATKTKSCPWMAFPQVYNPTIDPNE